MAANGNVYTFSRTGMSISTAITVLQLAAAAAKPVEILRAWASQQTSTTSVQAGITLVRKTGAATVTIAASTDIKKANPSDGTSSVQLGTALTGYTATVEGTDGDQLIVDGFNILSGWLYLPVPEERIVVPGGGILGLKFLTTQTAATYSVGLTYRELG